ncbi:hypothetical protein EDB86DRAFT_3182258 [Lactarius hatsudake]|nr:hypothetical protein EDB86DRAFT_3182258 [Lactarius hatsudake]
MSHCRTLNGRIVPLSDARALPMFECPTWDMPKRRPSVPHSCCRCEEDEANCRLVHGATYNVGKARGTYVTARIFSTHPTSSYITTVLIKMRYNLLSFALLLLSWWLLANVSVNFGDTTGHITFEHAWFDATNRRVAKLQFAFSFDLAVDVLTVILRAYLAETSMDHLADALKKGRIKDHTGSVLDAHFRSQVVDWWTRKQNAVIKEDIAKAIKESLEHEDQHERRRDKSARSVSGTHSWLAGNARTLSAPVEGEEQRTFSQSQPDSGS